MSYVRAAVLLTVLLAAGGCYHATIDTGLPPSNEVYYQSFASAWVFGLVPPKTVKASLECGNGVAKVETQLSFVNQLVGMLTIGIYTPMNIKVTCASSGATSEVPATPDIAIGQEASDEQIQQAFMDAAKLAVMRGEPVYVSY